ncbi:MAG TPA: glycosyltransferase family 2 protein [Acidimicrobiales bacterium]|nr:glycosyltransferase family 2 protein [Acidimicrobiales bacterium]
MQLLDEQADATSGQGQRDGAPRAAEPAQGRPASVSVVMPLFNEEDNVEPAVLEVLGVLDTIGQPAELIVVDDGSTDATPGKLDGLQRRDRRVKVVHFRRNFGQTAAIRAGVDHAAGDVVVLIDGDQQNDPADIPRLLEALDAGYDVVSGWRRDRRDALILRRLPSRAANALISRVTGVHLRDYGCTLKAYDAAVLRQVELFGELHRFIPALASMQGAAVLEMAVNHRPRTRGSSKYGISRLPRVVLDLITVKFLLSYRDRPMQLFGKAGLACAGLAVAAAARSAAGALAPARRRWTTGAAPRALPGVPAPSPVRARSAAVAFPARSAVPVVLAAGALQLIAGGLLAELLTRTYQRSAGGPPYAVRSTLGFEGSGSLAATGSLDDTGSLAATGRLEDTGRLEGSGSGTRLESGIAAAAS